MPGADQLLRIEPEQELRFKGEGEGEGTTFYFISFQLMSVLILSLR